MHWAEICVASREELEKFFDAVLTAKNTDIEAVADQLITNGLFTLERARYLYDCFYSCPIVAASLPPQPPAAVIAKNVRPKRIKN